MADIAMLVAEEYERRIKNTEKAAADGDLLEIKWVSFFLQKIKNKEVRENNLQLFFKKWLSEPKSQIGLAASNGFFSA